MNKSENKRKNLLHTFIKAYPLIYKPVWKENLLLSSVDIFHGMSFAVLIIMTQKFFDAVSDYLGGKGSHHLVIMISLALIGCQILSQILNGFTNFYEDVVKEKGYGRICVMIQQKIAKVSPIHFEENHFLDDINKADQGAEQACAMVDTINSVFTFYVPYFLLMGLYMYHLNAILILAVFLVFLPVLVTNYVQMHFGDVIEREVAPLRRESEAYEKTLTTLDSYKETKVLFAANYFIKLFRTSASKWNRVSWKRRKKEALIKLGLDIFSFLSYAAILLMLVYLCIKGEISIGSFAAVFSSIDVMFIIMEEIFSDRLGNVAKNVGRINNFLNLMECPEVTGENQPIDSGEIVLKQVNFRYPEADHNTLNGINLTIKNHETVAVVGENGSGKTTLSKVLMGLYQPDSGEVLIGGKRVDESHNCFTAISAVFQKFNRYKLNLEDNIMISDLADRTPYQKALIQVDKNLVIADDVLLSRDFDGIDLSGGQWQKIAITRGIHKSAKIIVLDEPTSAIDPVQESELYQTFLNVARDKTCIMITHRLGLARIADRVLVVKNGRIVEEGSHQELLARRGEYYRMWSAQAEWYHEGKIAPVRDHRFDDAESGPVRGA